MKNYLKTYVLFLLLMCQLLPSYAASNCKISGKVVFKNQPVLYATVAVYSAQKESLIGGTITDNEGAFELNAPRENSYVLVVSAIGFETQEISLSGDRQAIYQTVEMRQSVTELNEVKVEGAAIINKIDRDVVLVTKEMQKRSPSTIWLLRDTPGVEVDDLKNSIEVDGDNNVLLLVDGVKKPSQYIKNLNSQRIEKMEILRDVNGRYAMEGYSAVINVITRKNYQGFAVYLNDTEMFQTEVNRGENIDYNTRQKVNLDYSCNQWQWYGTFQHHQARYYSQTDDQIVMDNQNIMMRNVAGREYNISGLSKDLDLQVGTDFQLHKNHKIGVQYGYRTLPDEKNDYDKEFVREVYSIDSPTNPVQYYNYLNKNSRSSEVSSGQLTYHGKLSDKTTLQIETYYNQSNDKERDRLWTRVNPLSQNYKQNGKYLKSVVSISRSIGDKHTLGLDYSYIWRHNRDTVYSRGLVGSSLLVEPPQAYERTDRFQRLNGYFNSTLSKKITASLGLGTQWDKLGVADSYQMQMLYFGKIMYKPNRGMSFTLSYKSESENPYRTQTRDYITNINEYDVTKGNPKLASYVSQKASLSMTFFKNKLRVTPYYSWSNNQITSWGLGVQNIEGERRYVYSFINADQFTDMGVDFYTKIKLSKSFGIKVTGSYKNMEMTYQDISNRENQLLVRASLDYNLFTKGWYASLAYRNQLYHTPTLMGYTTEGNDNLSVSVMKSMMKRKLNVFVYYSLPFAPNNFSFSFDESWSDDRGSNVYKKVSQYDLSHLKGMLMISLTYNFRKGRQNKKIEKGDLYEKRGVEKPIGL
ncbi:outer membrane beta-barrel protein [Halosquirtibacter xylanolyticus]|uniref:TonB-dependent receptor n=1 Tax=Halosquirtibacter xylanolyticus TaxID=3374599 RepID=UPI0037488AE6|nr:outer membrane beta-barrel protein [Prolixibacteraceae bacterium]